MTVEELLQSLIDYIGHEKRWADAPDVVEALECVRTALISVLAKERHLKKSGAS